MSTVESLLEAVDESAALEALHNLGCTDGLPVVIPTPERVHRMVLATGMDSDLVLGEIGPSFGVASIDKVAIAAVMAGALPDYAPIIVAAVKALCRPEFDTAEVQATTHAVSPLLIINGPARAAGEVSHGFGALGPGHRANMTIGRAVRLVMLNVGGAHPGISDMALLGHPGKLAMCLAEDEEQSPWEPLHVSLGYSAEDSVLTMVGTEGPHSVISVTDADDPDSVDRLIRSIAAAVGSLAANNAHFHRGTVVVVLNPDHAAVLGKAGLSRSDVQKRIFESSHHPRSTLRAYNPSFAGRGNHDDRFPSVRSPQDLVILVAGGGGLYSTVFPSWGAGSHGNIAITELIDLGQACEIPLRV